MGQAYGSPMSIVDMNMVSTPKSRWFLRMFPSFRGNFHLPNILVGVPVLHRIWTLHLVRSLLRLRSMSTSICKEKFQYFWLTSIGLPSFLWYFVSGTNFSPKRPGPQLSLHSTSFYIFWQTTGSSNSGWPLNKAHLWGWWDEIGWLVNGLTIDWLKLTLIDGNWW